MADYGNNAIRKVKASDGVVTTLAGGSCGFADGSKTAAKFNKLVDIVIGSDANFYVADQGNF